MVRAIRADGLRLEINFRAELSLRDLQPETKRRRAFPIHQQQIVPAVAIHVGDLHGVRRAGKGNFLRLAQRVVRLLREKIQRTVVTEQNDAGAAVAVQIPGDQRVGVHPAVLDSPAFRIAPAVRALVVKHGEVFRVTVKNDVRAAVAVEVGHGHCGDVLSNGD